jgi:5-formyltetrahydrofolate cyclo-ligase
MAHCRLEAASNLSQTVGCMDLPQPSPGKAQVRREMRDALRRCSDRSLAQWSGQLIEQLKLKAADWPRGGVVALFGGLRSEPDLLGSFLPWLHTQGWQAALFEVCDQQLKPRLIDDPSRCRRSSLGVWEPETNATALELEDLSVVLVPALAYSTRDGTRLGRGGGFYDRLLSQSGLQALRLGVAYELQLLPLVPAENHDHKVPEVITEAGGLRWPPSKGT